MIGPVFLEDFFLLSVIQRKPNGINLLRNAYCLIKFLDSFCNTVNQTALYFSLCSRCLRESQTPISSHYTLCEGVVPSQRCLLLKVNN